MYVLWWIVCMYDRRYFSIFFLDGVLIKVRCKKNREILTALICKPLYYAVVKIGVGNTLIKAATVCNWFNGALLISTTFDNA